MAPRAKRQTREVLNQWIDDIVERGRDVSDWELSFVESISDQFGSGRGLSERQEEILEKIYVEKVK